MRKIESVGNAERSASLSDARRGEVVAERLLDDDPAPALGLVGGVVDEPGRLQLLGDQREVLRRDRQVERVVAHRAAFDVEPLDGLAQAPEDVRVVELARDEADALQQLLPRLFAELGARVLPDGVVDDLREVLVLPVATGEADQREAGRQQPAVGEVVHRRHELLAGEVSGHAEDDERARSGDAVEAAVIGVAQRVVPARDLDPRSSGDLDRHAVLLLGRFEERRALRPGGR